MSNESQKLHLFIDKIIKKKNTFIKEYLRNLQTLKKECFYFLTTGKSIRAILCGLSAADIGLPISKIIPLCVSLELIHLYSLIHDDLPAMDNATERRGKKSLHLAFGESAAILTGDLLQSKAYYLLYKYYRTSEKLIDSFFAATTDKGIIKGQVLDISYKLKNPSLPQLLNIYRFKTGALFSLAVTSPLLINHNTDKRVNLFRKIGEVFGIAYQIKDDIEDINNTLEPNIVRCAGMEKAIFLLGNYTKTLYKLTERFYFLNKFSKIVFSKDAPAN